MKKLYTLVFSILFSLAIFSQNVQTITYENYIGGNWQTYMKQSYTYNGSGYLTSTLTQMWNTSSNTWTSSTQINYINNVNGFIQEYTSQVWDSVGGAWVNSQHVTYTYNGANKPLTITFETYNGGNWLTSMKQTSTYDGSGYLIHSITQLWDIPSSTWKDNSQNDYTNNGNGTVQQTISQSWDTQNSVWKNSQRATYTYNTSDKPLTITYESYPSGSWQYSMKQTNTYDGSGYMTKSLTQLWDIPSSLFKDYSQINYTNNTNGSIHQYVSQNWNSQSSTWTNTMRATFAYTGSTGIAVADDFKFNIFPNPGSEKLNITLSDNAPTKISITNIHGQLLFAEIFSGSEITLDIKDLAPDIYFIILEQNNKISTSKFIKEK